jgi:hypothetical protein
MTDTSVFLVNIESQPDHQVDVELSDGDNSVLKKPASVVADGGGATLAEHVAPNPIDSNMLGQSHPSVVDRVKATTPSIGGQKRKRPPPALKRKQSKPPADQVITKIELPPYHRPRSPLDLVDVEIILGAFLKPFDIGCWCWNIGRGCYPACEENTWATPEEHPCA